jgi:hypothetical protein
MKKSKKVNIIEPTKSHLDEQGIYSGNSQLAVEHSNNYRDPNSSRLDRFKDGFKRAFKTVDNYEEKRYKKYVAKQKIQDELYKNTHYVKGRGYLSDAEVRALRRRGYFIESGAIKTIPKRTLLY